MRRMSVLNAILLALVMAVGAGSATATTDDPTAGLTRKTDFVKTGRWQDVSTNYTFTVTGAPNTVIGAVEIRYKRYSQSLSNQQPNRATITLTQEGQEIAAIRDEYQADTRRGNIPGVMREVVVPNVGLQCGKTATVVIDAQSGDGKNIITEVDVISYRGSAPRISREPNDINILAGGNVALWFKSTGQPAPTVQWYKDGSPMDDVRGQIAGTKAAIMRWTKAPTNANGLYWAVVSNKFGVISTRHAQVDVIPGGMFAAEKGTYYGLFVNTNSPNALHSGLTTVKMDKNGLLVAVINMAGHTVSVSGHFDINRQANAHFQGMSLMLELPEGETVTGQIAGTNWSAPLTTFNGSSAIAPDVETSISGTFLAQSDTNVSIQANSLLRTRAKGGKITAIGHLPDGQAFKSVPILGYEVPSDWVSDFKVRWPVYAWLPGGDVIIGWMEQMVPWVSAYPANVHPPDFWNPIWGQPTGEFFWIEGSGQSWTFNGSWSLTAIGQN